MGTLDILARTRFFRQMSAESLEALAAICQPRPTERRQRLFGEGEPGAAIYVVATGKVRLYRTNVDGREVVIKIVGAGEVFAEVILFETERYPVSAQVLEPGLVHRVPRSDFLRLLDGKTFRDDFIAMLMRKQRYLVGKVQELASSDVEARFRTFLREQYGGRDHFAIALSKKDVAGAIGTTPETFSRLLRRLDEDGLLSWAAGSVRVAPAFWERDTAD